MGFKVSVFGLPSIARRAKEGVRGGGRVRRSESWELLGVIKPLWARYEQLFVGAPSGAINRLYVNNMLHI